MISSQTWRLSFIFLVLRLNLLPALVKSQNPYVCLDDSGNYTRNSTYSNNLNILLSYLPSNMSNRVFISTSVGQYPYRANAMVLCRADIQPGECRSCVQNATSTIRNLCPNQKQAILWRETCMLRYSNEPISGVRADQPVIIFNNTETSKDPGPFIEDVRMLLDDLRSEAASGSSQMKAAAGNWTGPGTLRNIYGLVQCTPDISPEACTGCLIAAARQYEIPGCCSDRVGFSILAPSCNIRYEIYPFYNITRIQEAQATAPSHEPPGKGNEQQNAAPKNFVILVAIAVPLIIVASVVILVLRKKIWSKPEKNIDPGCKMSIPESLQYDFGKIRAATNNFSDEAKLGQGGFGAVYKGKLQDGREIAVKRLSRGASGQGDLEFENEVLLVARLQHKNLVRMLGFALKGQERLLIYEFVENASLDHFLFDPTKRLFLDLDKRHKIIMGIARGLLYLHEDSRLCIVHRDLKASNILLDGQMIAKIADFGMARLVVPDQSEGSTNRIVGTYGYMAPEYVMRGQFSVKSDVFSFGVLLLEIISGQKNSCFQNGENIEDMLSFAWRNWREGRTTSMVDPILRTTSSNCLREMVKCIHVGLLCVQENVAKRPTMASVVFMLNSLYTTLAVPSEPGFFVSSSISEDISPFKEHNLRELEFKRGSLYTKNLVESSISKNDVSITELYPR